MAEKHEGLFAVVGIHPNDAELWNETAEAKIREWSRHPKVVAIGEIGLDFYWDKAPVSAQEKAFRDQINLAKELDVPIVIHNREAGRQILDVLKSEGVAGLAGVFHCFSETMEIANEILELGFHISFTGNLTFKKSELPQVAKLIPIERLLLETDCPFLSPEPKRGRRNEPAHVIYIAQKLAEITGLPLEEIARITTENAHRLFGFAAQTGK
jgi:TatD DNase family protein